MRALLQDAAERPRAHVQAGVRGQRLPRGARPCLNTGPPHATPSEAGSGIGPARREASPTRPRSASRVRPGLPRAGEDAVRNENEAPPPRPSGPAFHRRGGTHRGRPRPFCLRVPADRTVPFSALAFSLAFSASRQRARQPASPVRSIVLSRLLGYALGGAGAGYFTRTALSRLSPAFFRRSPGRPP